MDELIKGFLRLHLVKDLALDSDYLALLPKMSEQEIEISFVIMYSGYLESNLVHLTKEFKPYLYDLFREVLQEELIRRNEPIPNTN